MKAYEAMELTNGSIREKKIFFQIRLSWLCGVLNSKIKSNAELGQVSASLDNVNKRTAKLYFPLMAKYYERDGYFVCYIDHYDYYNFFAVIWDKNKVPNKLYNYDYHTEKGE